MAVTATKVAIIATTVVAAAGATTIARDAPHAGGPNGSRDASRVVAPGRASRHDARVHRDAIGRGDSP